MPCYQYGHFLRECVESILTRSGPSVRVLVIDDASPDHTAGVARDLVREDSRVTFLRHTRDKGHIATHNEGIGGILEPNQAACRRLDPNMSLHYTAKSYLPDLEQRKAAFDFFFPACGPVLLDAQRLNRKLLRLLGSGASKERAGSGRESANGTIMDNVLRYADDPTPQCGPSPGRNSAE